MPPLRQAYVHALDQGKTTFGEAEIHLSNMEVIKSHQRQRPSSFKEDSMKKTYKYNKTKMAHSYKELQCDAHAVLCNVNCTSLLLEINYNRIIWYFCTMRFGASKHSAFVISVWVVINFALTAIPDQGQCNWNAVWQRHCFLL